MWTRCWPPCCGWAWEQELALAPAGQATSVLHPQCPELLTTWKGLQMRTQHLDSLAQLCEFSPVPGIISKMFSVYVSGLFQVELYLWARSVSSFFLSAFFFSAVPLHMDIPRLGIESELQLPPYASTTATPDPCYICNLHHSAQQCQILNPLSRARVWIHILMHTSRVHDHWATRELQGSFLFTNGYPEFVGKTILSSSNYIVTFIYENISCLEKF